MNDDKTDAVVWYFYCALRNTAKGANYSSGTVGTSVAVDSSSFFREIRAAIGVGLGWNDEFVLIALNRL